MFYTYVLQSEKDHRLYIGQTGNLEKRVQQHNAGKNISTKNRRPFILIYYEEFKTRNEARWREETFKKSHDTLKRAMQQYNTPS